MREPKVNSAPYMAPITPCEGYLRGDMRLLELFRQAVERHSGDQIFGQLGVTDL